MKYVAYFESEDGQISRKIFDEPRILSNVILAARIRAAMEDDKYFVLAVDETAKPVFGPLVFAETLRTNDGIQALADELEKKIVFRL